MSNQPPVRIQELKSGYGRIPILHGIDVEVQAKEIVGILGHNGMGKSTLMKTLIGLLPASQGKIILRGEDVTRLKTHQRALRGVAYVPQGRGIFPRLSVRDNLRFAWRQHDGEREADALANMLVTFPRLERLLDRDGGALSGGEQQLLALARALMARPWLLLLDEPTEGIQPSIIDEIAEMLTALKTRHDLTVLLVEQNFDFLSTLSDRVLILERGRIIVEFERDALRDVSRIEDFLGLGAVRQARPAFLQDGRPATP